MRCPALAILVALNAAACGGAPGAALLARGDDAAYLRVVAVRQRDGTLVDGDARELARIAARRAVLEARDAEALARIDELRACPRAIDDVLAARMRTADAAGAEAAWARLESGAMDAGDARGAAERALAAHPPPGDAVDRWRAIGAAGLTRGGDGVDRRRALVDPSPRVRRAALRAVREAREAADVEAVLEVVRLDPEPLVRTDAVRSLPTLPVSDGVAVALRDLWTAADEPLLQDLADAWASPALYDAGGREALRVLVSQDGRGALPAGLAVQRSPRARRDPVVADAAAAALVRALTDAPRGGRVAAIGAVPLDAPGAGAALERATTDVADVEVRVAALARLAGAARDERARRAHDGLLPYAALAGAPGARARGALAALGDRRVQAWIETDLAAESPALRVGAASALAALGRAPRAAGLLARSGASGPHRSRVRDPHGARPSLTPRARPSLPTPARPVPDPARGDPSLTPARGDSYVRERMRTTLVSVALAALALSSTGCIKSMLVNGQISSTRVAAGGLDTIGDLELVKTAAQAGLVQFEGMHRLAPDNTDALFLLTKGWVSYGYGFVEDEMEAAHDRGDDAAEEAARRRANLAYDRATAYGLELLGHRAQGFDAARKGEAPMKAWLKGSFDSPEDGETLFWAGYAWLARTALNKDTPAMVAELWVGVALLERSLELAPAYNNYAATVALASYHARSAGAEMDEAKRMFEDALAKTGRKSLLVQLGYATRYACAKQDAAMYSKLLQEVLAAPDSEASYRLTNSIAKRRAARWMSEKRAFDSCSIDLPAPAKK